jgi:hypothetical protein
MAKSGHSHNAFCPTRAPKWLVSGAADGFQALVYHLNVRDSAVCGRGRGWFGQQRPDSPEVACRRVFFASRFSANPCAETATKPTLPPS